MFPLLTGVDRIHADIILDRMRILGYRFSRPKMMKVLAQWNSDELEKMAGAEDARLDKEMQKMGYRL